jgi:hypothetical protein
VRTRTFGQNGSLALFNNLLTPYYSYTEVRSDTISGEVPGGGIDSRVITAGLSFFDGPFRARLEYGDVQWAISPWHGWRGELQYTGPLGPTTNVNAAASYQIRNVEESPEGDGPPPYTEKTFSASGNVQQYLLSRTLAVSGGGTFNWLTGLSESRSYSLNATLTWKIGKLDISGGATYSDTDTQNGTAYASRTVHRFYFLRLRRLLF